MAKVVRRKVSVCWHTQEFLFFLKILPHFRSEAFVEGRGWRVVPLIKTTQILFSKMWLAGAHVALICWDQIVQPSWI